MSYRRLMDPKFLIFTPLVLLLMALAACGGTSAEPIVVEKEVIKEIIKEVQIEKEVIKEVPVTKIVEKEVIKTVEKSYVVTRAAPTAVPKAAQTGKVVLDKLIAVLATPTKQSALDCQVTGSATVNHRPSVEYLLGVDHSTG